MSAADVIRADHPTVRRGTVDWHRPPGEPRESDAARTERVLSAQAAWDATHATASAEPWSPAAVAADLLRDPAVRQSAFGYALATHGAPVCEARGPADPPGPLESEYIRRERRAIMRAEVQMAHETGRPLAEDFYHAAGLTPPPDATKRAHNPF